MRFYLRILHNCHSHNDCRYLTIFIKMYLSGIFDGEMINIHRRLNPGMRKFAVQNRLNAVECIIF